jgi:glycosyltransferase involved in cell wall biosynthesis
MKIKTLFLYTELASYFLACVENLIKRGVEPHVMHLPVNKEAPFAISIPPGMVMYSRSDYTFRQIIELADNIAPNLIYCSGWMDRDYLAICKVFRTKIPVIVGFDNKWQGTFRQVLASVFSKLTVHRYFSHCWIPGKPQLEFAKRLGFENENILRGCYSCDYPFFHSLGLKYLEKKKEKFPRKFIFAGRYYNFKGVNDLWRAFIECQDENPNDWELWCLGAGDIKPVIHPGIKHFGFVQPGEIEAYIAQTGVFILPSRVEPWGVAVHEYAAAGFPLICSTAVGACDIFLQTGENGFLFQHGDIQELKEVLRKVMSMPDRRLVEMGQMSAALAERITPASWSATLMSVMNKYK